MHLNECALLVGLISEPGSKDKKALVLVLTCKVQMEAMIRLSWR